MIRFNYYYIFILIVTTILSCSETKNEEKIISNIKLHYKFIDFHKQFFNADLEKLKELKHTYPYLFPKKTSNEEWLKKIKNSDDKLLYDKVNIEYNNLDSLKENITLLYKHIKYYNKNFVPPTTITLINGLDYEHSIIYADSIALISLDMYLGAKSEVYSSFPTYLTSTYTKQHITVDLAKRIIHRIYKTSPKRDFLSSIINEGKLLYLTQLFLPKTKQTIILGINQTKLRWSLENESEIWKYFITKNYLYSTDKNLSKRFIDAAPFSKFYLENDKQSPGGIGSFIGSRIVRSYMENNNTKISQMLSMDANQILQNSKYKPNK